MAYGKLDRGRSGGGSERRRERAERDQVRLGHKSE
jgi:hypothetical protein